MKTVLTALALVCLSGPVLALSCLKPEVSKSFRDAAEASDDYIVVYGVLSFDAEAQPEQDLSQTEQQTTRLPARLEGKTLGLSGFGADFARDITLELACFGPWCGRAETNVKYLAFLRLEGPGHVMVVDPCYSWAFADPTDDQLKEARQCMRGGCQPTNE